MTTTSRLEFKPHSFQMLSLNFPVGSSWSHASSSILPPSSTAGPAMLDITLDGLVGKRQLLKVRWQVEGVMKHKSNMGGSGDFLLAL